ncbi:MAG: hypothetical protein CM1200mP30_17470 [Pseudomonadota bacterium]|nr:MAG: hypothetical protein CM1200mP30_17470 [Pseudomonadota bacterium]
MFPVKDYRNAFGNGRYPARLNTHFLDRLFLRFRGEVIILKYVVKAFGPVAGRVNKLRKGGHPQEFNYFFKAHQSKCTGGKLYKTPVSLYFQPRERVPVSATAKLTPETPISA